MTKRIGIAALALIVSACQQVDGDLAADDSVQSDLTGAALPFDEVGRSETLQGAYNDNWFFAHDMNFNTLGRGKIMVLDVAAENRNYRGAIDADQFATFQQSPKRRELYVAETFYSRGSRGQRTDALTIYDQDTLKFVDEIILPGNKRAQSVTQKASFQLTKDEKFALIYNFTPATSVTVVDLDSRKVATQIDIPGCTLVFPRGSGGFASLCGDGKMVGFDLNTAGEVAQKYETAAFNNIDDNPMFMKFANIGDVTYFPTFRGHLQPVKMGDGAPVPGDEWDFAGDSGWEPSGWQVITADHNERIYVLMRADAKEGDHKSGGSEVWVLNPSQKKIERKITLKTDALSIEATRAQKPLLVVTNLNMELDIYGLEDDRLIRTVGNFLSASPFVLHAAETSR